MAQLKVSCKKRHRLEVCFKLFFSWTKQIPTTVVCVCSNTKTSLSRVTNDHFEKTGGEGGISRRNIVVHYNPRRRKPIQPLAVLRVKPCCLPWKGRGDQLKGVRWKQHHPGENQFRGFSVRHNAKPSCLSWKGEPAEMCKLWALPQECWLFWEAHI